MTQRNPDRRLDFEALRHAIERSDPDLMLRFYAEDARLSIVNALHPARCTLSSCAERGR